MEWKAFYVVLRNIDIFTIMLIGSGVLSQYFVKDKIQQRETVVLEMEVHV